MELASALIKKTHFLPIEHWASRDRDQLYFQARGDGFHPVIKDGDILHIQQMGSSALRVGDLALVERPMGVFALRLILWNADCDGSTLGTITAINRERRTKRRDHRLARLSHIINFGARPLITIFLFIRKILSLFHPKFFVKDPELSLRCVAEKYNDPEEVDFYSHRAIEGLDEQEQHLLEQFMRRRGKVLNIGCGAGREAFAFAELGFEVTGIDVAPGMIAEAKRHAQTSGLNIRFEVKSATGLDYLPDSFDYVFVSEGVYSFLPTRDLRIKILRRIGELLTPDGILLFSASYNGNSVLSRVSLYSAFRRLAKPLLKERLHSEPGDVLVKHVSHVGTPSTLCYLHFFTDATEVMDEITSAGLDGFEAEKSGFWIVSPVREGNNRGTILTEVAG